MDDQYSQLNPGPVLSPLYQPTLHSHQQPHPSHHSPSQSTPSISTDSEIDDEDYIIQHSLANSSSQKHYHSLLLPLSASSNQPSSLHRSFKKRSSRCFQTPLRTLLFVALSLAFSLGLLFWLGSSSSFDRNISSSHSNLSSLSLGALRNLTLDDVFSGQFAVKRHTISWLKEAGDGVYSEITSDGIVLTDLKTNSTKLLLSLSDLVDPSGRPLYPESFTVSSDLRYVLVSSDSRKQWRYSTTSNYWIYDTQHKSITPLRPQLPSDSPGISIAQWSPTGHSIAYVYSNDIYVVSDPSQVASPLRLTTTGTATVFNGICDWVYEEEVLSGSAALWWAPDSSRLVWLSLDESAVPIYELTVYNPSNTPGMLTPYPAKTPMKYPKPGFANPVASVRVAELAKLRAEGGAMENFVKELVLEGAFGAEDRIVMEVAWVSAHELIIRETNRIATREKTGYFNFAAVRARPNAPLVGKVVMDVDFVELDGGWAEPGQSITPIDPLGARSDLASGYLDVRVNGAGYRHVAYFSPADASEPVFLSDGQWEVDGGVLAVDLERRLVYFIAANPSMERHIYSVTLPSPSSLASLKSSSSSTPIQRDIKPVTNGPGFYHASFSSLAGFYLVSYDGPSKPWQKLVRVDDPKFDHLVEDNRYLNQSLSRFTIPETVFGEIKGDGGVEMNVQEIRPLGMDLSGKTMYPVLFKVYGGPNSQTASKAFSVDWSHYLVSGLGIMVVYVDGRGTGFKGRKFRVGIRNQLGSLEADDVAAAARYYAKLKYVDADRIGVWGWSYGGYLTCKTAESHASDFSLALAVAPVTDWRFYDSIYTERYMSTPQLNSMGYQKSSVHDVGGFQELDGFSLAHGSSDDNVHFMNSAMLLDRLTASKIRGFQFRMFTDSDHSIGTRGAHTELMKWMTDFIAEKWELKEFSSSGSSQDIMMINKNKKKNKNNKKKKKEKKEIMDKVKGLGW